MQDSHQQNSKNFNVCMACLRNSKPGLSDKKLTQLINDFDHDPLAIKLLINYLDSWHGGQLSGLAYIPILHNNQEQDRSLRRLLGAFEYKFSGSAELTLLYLLSLSSKPVPLQQMAQIFRRTFINRLFARNSEYQRFLSPLSKLNAGGWHKMLAHLYRLNLLNYMKSAQGTLLTLEPRICHYFRQNLEAQQYRILQYAYKDMMIATSKTTSYGMPAVFSGIQLGKPIHQSKRCYAVARTGESSAKQLYALRKSLTMLAKQSRELSVLRQAPVLGNIQHQPDSEILIPDSSQAA